VYIIVTAVARPSLAPRVSRAALAGDDDTYLALALAKGLVPPLLLIVAVLGSILGGYATPTEAAGVGAAGSLLLALVYRVLGLKVLGEICRSTLTTTAMVFFILIGASIFSLVFRGYGGDEVVQSVFNDMPGGMWGALAIVMLVIFLLGFILDFIEITFVVVPIVGPVLLAMGFDPVWLGVMIAVNLQTSFLTPPFGFALFYLRGVAPAEIHTTDIYRGVMPFIGLQLLMLGLLVVWPRLATWLPGVLYG
jgi:tripartite ATP-independent transporter DctM subunit